MRQWLLLQLQLHARLGLAAVCFCLASCARSNGGWLGMLSCEHIHA